MDSLHELAKQNTLQTGDSGLKLSPMINKQGGCGGGVEKECSGWKIIEELIELNFWIKLTQKGYSWTKKNVLNMNSTYSN